jgi:hypothetical protein
MDTLKYISADDEIRAIANLRQRTINDKDSELAVAKEEGIAIGQKRGELKKAKETAKKLLSRDMNVAEVAEITD